MRSGDEQKLVSALDSSEQALYLEQEIERFLGSKMCRCVGRWRGESAGISPGAAFFGRT